MSNESYFHGNTNIFTNKNFWGGPMTPPFFQIFAYKNYKLINILFSDSFLCIFPTKVGDISMTGQGHHPFIHPSPFFPISEALRGSEG
jgi:hypothetical protein